jgi:hypothetical protein
VGRWRARGMEPTDSNYGRPPFDDPTGFHQHRGQRHLILAQRVDARLDDGPRDGDSIRLVLQDPCKNRRSNRDIFPIRVDHLLLDLGQRLAGHIHLTDRGQRNPPPRADPANVGRLTSGLRLRRASLGRRDPLQQRRHREFEDVAPDHSIWTGVASGGRKAVQVDGRSHGMGLFKSRPLIGGRRSDRTAATGQAGEQDHRDHQRPLLPPLARRIFRPVHVSPSLSLLRQPI